MDDPTARQRQTSSSTSSLYVIAKCCTFFAYTVSLEPFKTNWNRFHQNVPKISGNKDYVAVFMSVLFLSILSRPRSEGWTQWTYFLHLSPSSRVLIDSSMGSPVHVWCCLSRPCVVFLACVHPALFLALSLSPHNSFVSSWCDQSMLASLLWRCLAVPSLLQLSAVDAGYSRQRAWWWRRRHEGHVYVERRRETATGRGALWTTAARKRLSPSTARRGMLLTSLL